ncbi:MAG: hypothetical protein Tsb0019_15750 [Roseibium sp.]
MGFIERLSPRATNAFYRALDNPTDWAHVVWLCIEEGERNADFLADIPFHINHRELGGRNVLPHEDKLITEWKAWRWTVTKMLPDEKVKTRKDPTLTNWLEVLDVSKCPWEPQHSVWSHANRLADLERFRLFMIEASKNESLHDTTYHLFKYQSGLHSGIWAQLSTHYVLSFWKVGQLDALAVLKGAMTRNRGNMQGMGKAFCQLERNFYAHVNIFARWAHSTSTSDGPTDYESEMKWLRDLVFESKFKTSIYSVHAYQLKRVLQFKTDPNPHTAGLPF